MTKNFGCVPKEKAAMVAFNMVQVENLTGRWWKSDATLQEKAEWRALVDKVIAARNEGRDVGGNAVRVIRAFLEI